MNCSQITRNAAIAAAIGLLSLASSAQQPAAPAPAGQAPGAAAGGGGAARGGGGGRGGGGIPNATPMQNALVQAVGTTLAAEVQAATAAQTALTSAAWARPRNDAEIKAKADALAAAELNLANARANWLAKIQASADKFSADQLPAVRTAAAAGGRGGGGGFTQPEPRNFQDHDGWISIFDGTLKGWTGNPALWKIINGEIVADTTTGNFGTTYLVRDNLDLKDFGLKIVMKMGGGINSGIQYRGWITNPGAQFPNMGGYQFDMDARNQYTGDLYEQSGRGITTYPGQIVELLPPLVRGAPSRHLLLGTVGDLAKDPTASFVRPPASPARAATANAPAADANPGEYNEFEIYAHGNTLTHLVNGHISSITIDDNPEARKLHGLIGLEVEAQGQVWIKEIYYKVYNDSGDRGENTGRVP